MISVINQIKLLKNTCIWLSNNEVARRLVNPDLDGRNKPNLENQTVLGDNRERKKKKHVGGKKRQIVIAKTGVTFRPICRCAPPF